MASTKLQRAKSGKEFYMIRVSRGMGKIFNKRWYVPEGLSKKSIERQLQKAVRDFEAEIDNGGIITRRQKNEAKQQEAAEHQKIKTVKQYAESVFLPALTATCSENFRLSATRELTNHIYPIIGELPIESVKSAELNGLLLNLQKELKTSSVLRTYTILSMLFKKAFLEEVIEMNPMERTQRPKATKSESKDSTIGFFDEKTITKILKCLSDEVEEAQKYSDNENLLLYLYARPVRWRALTRLLIDTGCRRGEILALRWSDIDFKTGNIEIAKSLNYSPDKGIYVGSTKSGRSRTVYCSLESLAYLRELRRLQDTMFPVIDINTPVNSRYVFTQDTSLEPMHPDSPTRYYKKFGERYGIPDFHPHKLRHSMASIAITNGADVASVSEILGHADKSTTLRMYTHADEAAKKRASETFLNALKLKEA